MTLIRHSLALLTLLAATHVAAQGDSYPRVKFETNAGDFVIEVDAGRAPLTAASFLELVNSGFYEGTIFHRVVAGFVAQGGGYTPDFNKKPTDNSVPNEAGNGLSNRRGTVAMARTGDPHSADSQFYINLQDNTGLDPRPTRWGYAVFGEVVEGMDIVDDIGHRPTGPGGPFPKEVPQSPVIIEKASVVTE